MEEWIKTEKRFKKDRGTFWDNDKRLSMDETVTLLNAQHEEIQSLKDQLRNLRRLVNEAYMEGSE